MKQMEGKVMHVEATAPCRGDLCTDRSGRGRLVRFVGQSQSAGSSLLVI